MSNDMGVMEFEADARHVDHRARLAIISARFTPGQRYRVTVTPADAPKPLGLTFERAQAELPWTVPYSAELEASSSAMPHLHASHAVLHVAKSAGKLAAVYEQLDHAGGEVSGSNLEAVKASASSLVMCALRIANLHKFSLEDALCAHVLEKNGVGFGGTTAPADAPKPEPFGWCVIYSDGSRSLFRREQQGIPSSARQTPLYEHPPATAEATANETLAERMHREGWRTEVAGDVARVVSGWRQNLTVNLALFKAMREIETPPAVKVARQLHSEGWRTRGKGYVGRDINPACCDWMTPQPAVYAAMREIEKEETNG